MPNLGLQRAQLPAARNQRSIQSYLWPASEHGAQQQQQEMVPRGLEPRTLRLLAVRSNQLSYETLKMQGPAISSRSNLNASIGAGQGEELH